MTKYSTDLSTLDLPQSLKNLRDRVDRGVIYCDKLHSKKEKCVRLINKYDCETCDENKLLFCKAWRKIISLTKEYYILQIIFLLHEHIGKGEQFPEWAKHQKKAEIQMEQQNLFKLR